MDCEVLQQFQRYFDPIISDVGEGSLAVEAIREVGPNGHFFGCDHTQERYTNAFYSPFLSDWRNYEAWKADGEIWAHKRANKIWKKILEDIPEHVQKDLKFSFVRDVEEVLNLVLEINVKKK